MAGLFGPSAAEVQQRMQAEIAQNARNFSGLTGGAVAGTLFGRAAQNLMGQADDPRLRKAQALQNIEQQMTEMGLQPGTPEFTKTLGQLMMTRVGPQEAAQAVTMARQMELQKAEVDAVRNPPEVAAAQNRARALQGFANMSPAAAEILAPMKEVSEAVLKGALSPKEVSDKLEYLLELTGGNIDEARKLGRAALMKPSSVVNVGDREKDKIRARLEVLTDLRDDAQERFNAAQKAHLADKTDPAKRRAFVDAGASLTLAKASLANWQGEPSGNIADRYAENVPGTLGSLADSVVDSAREYFGVGEGAEVPNQDQVRKALNLPEGTKILSIKRVK